MIYYRFRSYNIKATILINLFVLFFLERHFDFDQV